MSCKGLCKYKYETKPLAGNPKHLGDLTGFQKCSVSCGVRIKCDDVRCPCCHQVFRTRVLNPNLVTRKVKRI